MSNPPRRRTRTGRRGLRPLTLPEKSRRLMLRSLREYRRNRRNRLQSLGVISKQG